jgi:ankyrin repeat protein
MSYLYRFFSGKLYMSIIIFGIVLVVIIGVLLFYHFGPTHKLGRSSVWVFPESSSQKLADAAARGHTEKVKSIIAAGANPNYVGRNATTPLLWAMLRSVCRLCWKPALNLI